MKPSVHTHPDGLDRVWRTEILPLLEELHYGEGVDIDDAYGLAVLRARLTPPTGGPPGEGSESAAEPTEQP
jgi:5-methylcytosine-specific restriction protein B